VWTAPTRRIDAIQRGIMRASLGGIKLFARAPSDGFDDILDCWHHAGPAMFRVSISTVQQLDGSEMRSGMDGGIPGDHRWRSGIGWPPARKLWKRAVRIITGTGPGGSSTKRNAHRSQCQPLCRAMRQSLGSRRALSRGERRDQRATRHCANAGFVEHQRSSVVTPNHSEKDFNITVRGCCSRCKKAIRS